MPSLTSAPPERPPVHSLAVILHAVWGGFALAATLLFAFLAGGGTILSTIIGIASQEEDAIGVAVGLALLCIILLIAAASSAISLVLAYKAWGMKRFWVWALMIWSIIHVSSGCGIVLTILTVVGGIQVLEATRDAEPAPAA